MRLTNDEKRILVEDIYNTLNKNKFDQDIQEQLDAVATKWLNSTDKMVLDIYKVIPASYQVLKVFNPDLYSKVKIDYFTSSDCYNFLNNKYSSKEYISRSIIQNVINKVLLDIKLGANKNNNLKELIIKECTKQLSKSLE